MADSVCICCGSVSLRCQKKCSADHGLEKFAVSTGVKGDTSATFTKLDGCKGMTSELALSVTGRWLSIPSQRDRAGEVDFSDRSSAVSPPQIPYGSSAWSAWDRQSLRTRHWALSCHSQFEVAGYGRAAAGWAIPTANSSCLEK